MAKSPLTFRSLKPTCSNGGRDEKQTAAVGVMENITVLTRHGVSCRVSGLDST